jgi:ketosteroid isomerase-like protein
MVARFRTLCLVATVALVSIGHAQGPTLEAMLAVSPSWGEHFSANDADALAAIYTDDATLMPPNQPLIQGSDALRALVQFYWDLGVVRSDVHQVTEYGMADDWGWGSGPYVLMLADGTVVDTGKYVVIYRVVDGGWRISHHIWNSDLAPVDPAD